MEAWLVLFSLLTNMDYNPLARVEVSKVEIKPEQVHTKARIIEAKHLRRINRKVGVRYTRKLSRKVCHIIRCWLVCLGF